MRRNKGLYLAFIIVSALVTAALTACSTAKNTSKTRWWHSFNAKYNTYYNGSTAYIDGYLEKENGNKDNFTEMIPLFTVGNKSSRELGKGNFDRAIEKSEKAIQQHSIKARPEWNKSRKKTEKDIEWLNRREYNPFLWKAWLLMGKAQFQEGDFEGAAATFAYMSRIYQTQPAIYGRARAWLARCYTELDWMYDAEDVITKMKRDSIHWRAQKTWNCTYADYYIHQKQWDEAVVYLKKMIKQETRKKQKAREYFLLGQIEIERGNKQEAYKAFQKVIRQNPPYELEFNARIAQTEVMAASDGKKMISRLKRMATSDNNKDYLDQVYYAIGNIYLAQKDTTKAIENYEKGVEKATRSGVEKGVLLLTLGDVYWQKEKYGDAQRCYGQAIGLLDKERDDYAQLEERSKVLDELAPYTEAVDLQDSLQRLAKMPEAERLKIIDKIIDDLKKKEKEEKRQAQLALVEQNSQQGNVNATQKAAAAATTATSTSGAWYFYNPITVSQGKQTFQRQWGKRENADNWQRINKTVVEMGENYTDEDAEAMANDSTLAAQDSTMAQGGTEGETADSLADDPHNREYYLAQIPFTEEQVAASNLMIQDGLYHSGVIFKDKLDNLRLSEKAFTRITGQYPEYTGMPDVYYHLFLLYSRKGDYAEADKYLQKLKDEYPSNDWTTILSDPYFKENAKFGEHIEDSLYAATYEAFKKNNLSMVRTNSKISAERFPLGANRDKFIFIEGLGKLNDGDGDGCMSNMRLLVQKYPESELGKIAGMIINGVQSGRSLKGGFFNMEDVWNKRTVHLSDSDSIAARKLSAERVAPFTFMLVYKPDTLDENKLLYQMAKYNFTNFMVRNFDMEFVDDAGLRRYETSGFLSYDEALQYARALYANKEMAALVKPCRPIIISDANKEMLGKQFSYAEYDAFYKKHFETLKITQRSLLSEPEPQSADEQFIEQDKNVRRQEEIRQQQQEEQRQQQEAEQIDEGLPPADLLPVPEPTVPANTEEFPQVEAPAVQPVDATPSEEGLPQLDLPPLPEPTVPANTEEIPQVEAPAVQPVDATPSEEGLPQLDLPPLPEPTVPANTEEIPQVEAPAVQPVDATPSDEGLPQLDLPQQQVPAPVEEELPQVEAPTQQTPSAEEDDLFMDSPAPVRTPSMQTNTDINFDELDLDGGPATENQNTNDIDDSFELDVEGTQQQEQVPDAVYDDDLEDILNE